jgi:hypothetical protein
VLELVRFDAIWVGPLPRSFADARRYGLRRQSEPNDGGDPSGLLDFAYTDRAKVQPLPDPMIEPAAERSRVIRFPVWVPAAALAALPGARLWRWWQRRGRQGCQSHQCCPSCGYDLRATPGRCPECGNTAG